MDVPPPDPVKILEQWMEWERGDATPGRAMANMKTAGLRVLLEQLVASLAAPEDTSEAIDDGAAEAWRPTV